MTKGIYIITGIMAAGKSTIAEALSHSIPKCVHLRGDIFRTMIVNGREEMCHNPTQEALRQLNMRYSITAKAAIEYYENGFTVVVQDNYLGEKLNSFVAHFAGYPTFVIVLNPDIKTVEKREKDRCKKGYQGYTVEQLHTVFVEETPKIGLWLDTSNMSVEETVMHIHLRAEIESRYLSTASTD